MSITGKRWVLAARPRGEPCIEDFRLETFIVDAPAEGEVAVRTLYHPVDPGMRGRLSADSYLPSIRIGETISSASHSVCIVEQSVDDEFSPGDLVTAPTGWASHGVFPHHRLEKLTPRLFERISPTAAIGVLGIPGLTAYYGLIEVCKIKAGETVLVSSAAGTVGSTAGQIAKLSGCRVVGVAGGHAKRSYVVDELGFDACIDYKNVEDLTAAVGAACPHRVDVFFDNVGGATLDAALLNMNVFGRIVISGMVSEYNRVQPHGIRHISSFLRSRLTMTGIVVLDFERHFEAAKIQLADWVLSGAIKTREEIIDGIESSPAAFLGLFRGENNGRRLVKVS